MLRSRRFCSDADLIMLYKSRVFSYIEYRTAGINFASNGVLRELDDVKKRFVRQFDMSEEAAFMHFILAPLETRRDIAILGVIHCAAMREGPPQLWKVVCRAPLAHVPVRSASTFAPTACDWSNGQPDETWISLGGQL